MNMKNYIKPQTQNKIIIPVHIVCHSQGNDSMLDGTNPSVNTGTDQGLAPSRKLYI